MTFEIQWTQPKYFHTISIGKSTRMFHEFRTKEAADSLTGNDSTKRYAEVKETPEGVGIHRYDLLTRKYMLEVWEHDTAKSHTIYYSNSVSTLKAVLKDRFDIRYLKHAEITGEQYDEQFHMERRGTMGYDVVGKWVRM